MKKQQIKELLALGGSAISGKITELKKELEKSGLDLKRGKLTNLRARRGLKRTIAVLKTHVSQGVK